MDYTTLTRQQIENYTTLSMTPQGNFITSPIICDKIFSQNGLYSDSGEQLSKKSKYYLSSTTADTHQTYNWKIESGFVGTLDSNGSVTSSSSLDTSRALDFGRVMEKSISSKDGDKFPTFKYVNCSQNVAAFYGSKKISFAKNSKLYVERQYKLENWAEDHPQLKGSPECSNFSIQRFPFFFMINLSQKSKGSAVLQWGASSAPITLTFQRDKTQLSIGAGQVQKKTKLDLGYQQNNKPTLPYFAKQMGMRTQTVIVYPTHLGISVQPGVWQTGNVAPAGVNYQIPMSGGFCQFGGLLAESTLSPKYQRAFPTFPDWIKYFRTKDIYNYPWHLPWANNSSLKLTFKNATGSFFFAPLLFLKYAKFRMYFKGAKAGKYDENGLPKSDNYKDSGTCSSTSSGVSIWGTKRKANSNDTDLVEIFKVKYYCSLIFSSEHIQGDVAGATDNSVDSTGMGKIRNFITMKTAYRIPPPNPDTVGKDYFKDRYNADSYYADFQICVNEGVDSPFTRLPMQIQGVIILKQTTIKKSIVENDNGSFKLQKLGGGSPNESDFLPIYDNTIGNLSDGWVKAITQVSVTHNQQGSNGTITLDKYVLMGQQQLPAQYIGGLQLKLKSGTGNTSVINCTTNNSDRNGNHILFTGFVTKITSQDSKNSDTITLNLQGMQRKLTDIKLINPPFWDGDPLKDVLSWVSKYAGVTINYKDDGKDIFDKDEIWKQMKTTTYIDMNGNSQEIDRDKIPILPTSTVVARPAVNYKTGTDCFQMLKDVCFQCANHRFVLQPDAQAYIYTQNQYSLPLPCQKKNAHKAAIKESLILNFSMQPLMSNLYNFVLSAALQGDKQGVKNVGEASAAQGVVLNQKYSTIYTTGTPKYTNMYVNLPWSKVIARKHEGFMSQKELAQQHARDVRMSKNYWLNVKVTIPGNTNIWIYDNVTLFGVTYYVTQVSHSLDLTTKSFKTDVTMSSCIN